MGINYSEAIGLAGFEDIDGFELSAEEQAGVIAVDGILAHPPNLANPGGPPGFEPKYGVELMIEKGSEGAQLVFASGAHVLGGKWGEGSEREYDIAAQLASGFKGKHINWSIMDGDQNEPEWNLGYWVLKPRSIDEVPVLDERGHFVEDPALFPRRNWAVRCFVEQWAQQKQDRLNVRLLGVQIIRPNARQVGRSLDQTKALLQGLVAKLPALPAGPAPQRALPAQAAQEPVRRAQPAAPAQAPRRRAAVAPAPAQAAPAPAPARRRAAPAPAEAVVEAEVVLEPEVVVETPGPRRRAAKAQPAEDPADSFRAAPPARRRRVVEEPDEADLDGPDAGDEQY